MCTIITLFQVHPTFPLVIAANRDERYARASSGPAVLEQPPAVVAGRDLEFGGTWFGLNAHGLAVAVADQGLAPRPPGSDRPPQPPNPGGSPGTIAPAGTAVWSTGAIPVASPPGLGGLGGADAAPARPVGASDLPKRSRGLLVLDALGCPSVATASALLESVDPADYNPFTVLHADPASAAIAHHADGPVRLRPLASGIDVMVSAIGADHARWRTEHVLGALDAARLAALAPAALSAALQAVLRHHAPAGARDDAICRHRADSGTVSSFVALLGPDLAASQLHCALGAPCHTPYADYSHLLRALAAAPVSADASDRLRAEPRRTTPRGG